MPDEFFKSPSVTVTPCLVLLITPLILESLVSNLLFLGSFVRGYNSNLVEYL